MTCGVTATQLHHGNVHLCQSQGRPWDWTSHCFLVNHHGKYFHQQESCLWVSSFVHLSVKLLVTFRKTVYWKIFSIEFLFHVWDAWMCSVCSDCLYIFCTQFHGNNHCLYIQCSLVVRSKHWLFTTDILPAKQFQNTFCHNWCSIDFASTLVALKVP